MTDNINGPGYMTEMTVMPIYGKNFSRTRCMIILKLSMEHQGIRVYKVRINDDPWLTLTNITAKSNLLKFACVLFLGPVVRLAFTVSWSSRFLIVPNANFNVSSNKGIYFCTEKGWPERSILTISNT